MAEKNRKLLICGLPIPKRCEFRNHNEIPNNLPKQKKSVRWQNYAKTNQANENITATKSGQDTRSAAQWVGYDSRVWVLVVPQMLCLIGISWVLSCCFLSSSSPLLGSMTTFFYAIPSGRGAGRKEEISPEVLNLSRFDRRLPLPVNSTNNLRNAIR